MSAPGLSRVQRLELETNYHQQPYLAAARQQYTAMLDAMCKLQAEVEAARPGSTYPAGDRRSSTGGGAGSMMGGGGSGSAKVCMFVCVCACVCACVPVRMRESDREKYVFGVCVV